MELHPLYVAIYCYESPGKANRYLKAWCSIARDDYGSMWLNRTWTPPSTGQNPNQIMYRVASPEELSDGAPPSPKPLVPAPTELYDYLLSNWELGATAPLTDDIRDFVRNNFANSPIIYDIDPYKVPLDQLIDMGTNGFVDFFGVQILGNLSDKGTFAVTYI